MLFPTCLSTEFSVHCWRLNEPSCSCNGGLMVQRFMTAPPSATSVLCGGCCVFRDVFSFHIYDDEWTSCETHGPHVFLLDPMCSSWTPYAPRGPHVLLVDPTCSSVSLSLWLVLVSLTSNCYEWCWLSCWSGGLGYSGSWVRAPLDTELTSGGLTQPVILPKVGKMSTSILVNVPACRRRLRVGVRKGIRP